MKVFFYLMTMILIAVLFYPVNAQNNKSDYNLVNKDTFDIDNRFISTKVEPIPDDIREKCSDFFNSLMKETVSEAYNNLFRGSPISRNQDKIRNLVVSTAKAIEIYGKIYGYESVGINKLSPSYSIVKYFSLHSLNPIEWTITFYKSPTIGWIVLNFKFSDSF